MIGGLEQVGKGFLWLVAAQVVMGDKRGRDRPWRRFQTSGDMAVERDAAGGAEVLPDHLAHQVMGELIPILAVFQQEPRAEAASSASSVSRSR